MRAGQFPTRKKIAAFLLLTIGVAAAQENALFGASALGAAGDATSKAKLIEERQHLMREDGELLKGLRNLPSEADLSNLEKLVANLRRLPSLFPKGSLTEKSHALPAVWDEPEQFASMFHEAEVTSSAMLQAVQVQDPNLYGDSYQGLIGACSECHQVYRQSPGAP